MYYDLLAKIKNAEAAKKTKLTVPFSKFDLAVAMVLVKAGYLSDVQKKSLNRKNFLEIKLVDAKKRPAVNGFKIISKPSRRIYIDYRHLRPVKQGYGLAVISTPLGVLSGQEAKKNKVGGEYLFQVW
jgi:small subunit ribosomal protein S8